MTHLLTAAEMREIEMAAIERGRATGLELMERAGEGAAKAIVETMRKLRRTNRTAIIVCGPGNNGGDGFVVARYLKQRDWFVELFFYGDRDKLSPDARQNHDNWSEIGDVHPFDGLYEYLNRYVIDGGRFGYGVLVDAVFGIGLTRPIPEEMKLSFTFLNGNRPSFPERDWTQSELGPVIALDMPSGVSADTGRVVGDDPKAALRADLTLAFDSAKQGHYLADGADWCGTLREIDIGLGNYRVFRTPSSGKDLFFPDIGVPVVETSAQCQIAAKSGHKYDHGHTLILSGGVGQGGAARMAARAALRVGTGLVTVGCPPAALIENAAQLNAVMLRSLKDADALAQMLQDRRINSLALGPGMGTGAREVDLIRAALAPDLIRGPGDDGATEDRWAGAGLVLDADALTLIARHDDLRALVHDRCVLTPHAGEFARLFPDISAKLDATPTDGPAYSQVDAARDAAAAIGATVLLKGPATVIAHPDGRAAINAAVYDRAAPWLATAGSGDVLSGMIAGLMARDFEPFYAARAGAWLHTEAALKFGPGLIAEDLPDLIPRVLADLGA